MLRHLAIHWVSLVKQPDEYILVMKRHPFFLHCFSHFRDLTTVQSAPIFKDGPNCGKNVQMAWLCGVKQFHFQVCWLRPRVPSVHPNCTYKGITLSIKSQSSACWLIKKVHIHVYPWGNLINIWYLMEKIYSSLYVDFREIIFCKNAYGIELYPLKCFCLTFFNDFYQHLHEVGITYTLCAVYKFFQILLGN